MTHWSIWFKVCFKKIKMFYEKAANNQKLSELKPRWHHIYLIVVFLALFYVRDVQSLGNKCDAMLQYIGALPKTNWTNLLGSPSPVHLHAV